MMTPSRRKGEGVWLEVEREGSCHRNDDQRQRNSHVVRTKNHTVLGGETALTGLEAW